MKRMRSWWLAAAACAVLAAALLLPQRLLQQKLDRVTETDFSVDAAEPDMEEVVTLMERLRLAAVGEFIAQNTGDDAGALTAQTQQWLLDAQSVIPQPIPLQDVRQMRKYRLKDVRIMPGFYLAHHLSPEYSETGMGRPDVGSHSVTMRRSRS